MFQIKGFADYYAMLVEDFDEYMREIHSSRKAIHCAITANHMKDWVWNDWLATDEATKTKLNVKNKAEFYKLLGTNIWYSILRDLAEGAKHFADAKYDTQLVTGAPGQNWGLQGKGFLVIDLGEVGDEHDQELLDEFGEPFDDPGPPETRFLNAAALLEVIVRFWRDFFQRYRPDLPLKHSTHHTFPG